MHRNQIIIIGGSFDNKCGGIPQGLELKLCKAHFERFHQASSIILDVKGNIVETHRTKYKNYVPLLVTN